MTRDNITGDDITGDATTNGSDLIQALLEAIARGDDEAAEAVAQACAGQPRLLPALRPLLADSDTDRRWWAVRTLALIGGPEAPRLLTERLADPDEATRCAAALGLGQLRAAAAVEPLAAALTDPSGWVRDSAGDALALIGEPALPALVRCMGSGPGSAPQGVRVRASAALRKIVTPALAGLRVNEYPKAYLPALTVLFEALNDPNRLVRHNAYEALDGLGLLDTLFFTA
jgi:HEAT repeat protein